MRGYHAAAEARSSGTYTPGCAKRKLLMAMFGLVLIGLGLSLLRNPIRLLLFGRKTRAEVVSVLKTKKGFPDVVLTDNIEANLEPRDRAFIFWNVFRFHTDDGRTVDVRATVGSQLKPLFPLNDPDGLPTVDWLYYDQAHPETVVFPLIASTWFIPGMLVLIGIFCTSIASVLFYWADKPIELPHL